ncbi:hypothetical protein B0H19DRAFT_1061394 [Mycena capillaripes]|nr:hypothetical protein B0H19DRAFT_1061394 [Mycena capillaripes]
MSSSASEASLSFLQSELPTSTATRMMAAALILALMAGIIHYTSPTRLTEVLVTTIHEVERSYLDAIETGVLAGSDVDTDTMLFKLQLKVSFIREATLHHSLSTRETFKEFLSGRTFKILRCIWEYLLALTRELKILKEEQLRDLNPLGTKPATRTVSLRRRRNHSTRCIDKY